MADKDAAKPRKETLFERRARIEQQLERQRAELAVEWRALEHNVHSHERRIAGFSRGFRAVLSVGGLAGTAWLVRRYGPARLARPVMLALSGVSFLKRLAPAASSVFNRNPHGQQTTRWLPVALALFNGIRKYRDSHQRRHDLARAREKAYRRGRRDGRVRRQS